MLCRWDVIRAKWARDSRGSAAATRLHPPCFHSCTGLLPAGAGSTAAAAVAGRAGAPWSKPADSTEADTPHASLAAPATAGGAAGAAAAAAEPLNVTVLGAGQDVGRSAIYVRRGERGLLFDCGSHLGAKQARKLPLLNMLLQLTPNSAPNLELKTMEEAMLQPSPLFASCTDAALISHFHMDHCGSLPSFTERLGYRNPIAMTYPTRALSPVLLLDSARIFKEAAFRGRQLVQEGEAVDNGGKDGSANGNGGNSGGDGRSAACASQEQWNYTEAEAQRCMRRCVALRLHESWEAGGWTATPYYAGHVLGAAMLHAQLPGDLSIVYTGDFNTAPDRHLGSASIHRLRPDLLISECTYGSFVRPSKRITEREFCDAVHDALKKGGKVLIPVFAVGRAQELCMLLNSYWQRMQLQYPIYFGGGMTEKANKYYKLYVQWTGSDLVHRLDCANTVQRAFADHVEEDPACTDVLTAPTPVVLLATPGMLHGGLALKALKLWAGGSENLVLLPGYCVRGTVGAMLIDGQRDIPLDARTRLKVLCKVRYMSFSAHADTTGIQQLARHLQPKAVMLVHGEKEGMLKLARVLQRELGVPVHTPPTGQTVSLPMSAPECRFPVYIHGHCLSRTLASAKDAVLDRVSPPSEVSWDCDDPTLASLLGSPAMQRYLSPTALNSRFDPCARGSLSPYFLPRASLFFSVSPEARGKPEAVATGSDDSAKSSRNPSTRVLCGDVNLLVDFDSLAAGSSTVTLNGCGSLKHSAARGSVPIGTTSRLAQLNALISPPNCAGATCSRGNTKKSLYAESASAVSQNTTACAAVVPPRCLQLVALRYRHEIRLEASVFQQLLHLFMDYVVQCRHAYEQQRIQSGVAEGNPQNASHALETPEFCDFGPRIELREMDGGGVFIAFLSLIAVHDGQGHLRMQWADADEQRHGAVCVFVEYFSAIAGVPAAGKLHAES
ncbi:uncharacterized protein LOC34622775 [Cyclospora cayetanensis]|uniref:Uncharacterized protein LOC34622775 n=1 Tax=Cyclospora cayetanensis TaxID=88456 RepID=A0A6P6RRM9_9EIME|nr:uncharacterized protein LOC34622775 [Cyclospora cayetanensis]